MRKDLIWHDNIEQNSPEWFNIRRGKFTGTTAGVLLTNGVNKDGTFRKGSIDGICQGMWTQIYRAAGQIVSRQEEKPEYDGWDTRRGKNMEPLAREAYMEWTFEECHKVGFVEWKGMYAGCSPDFMVNEFKGGEIKCLGYAGHMARVHRKMLDPEFLASPEHLKQIQWSLFVTGFTEWDVVHWHPQFGNKSLLIDTVHPDHLMHDKYDKGLKRAIEEIKSLVRYCRA